MTLYQEAHGNGERKTEVDNVEVFRQTGQLPPSYPVFYCYFSVYVPFVKIRQNGQRN